MGIVTVQIDATTGRGPMVPKPALTFAASRVAKAQGSASTHRNTIESIRRAATDGGSIP
jgi:hypothetical protein